MKFSDLIHKLATTPSEEADELLKDNFKESFINYSSVVPIGELTLTNQSTRVSAPRIINSNFLSNRYSCDYEQDLVEAFKQTLQDPQASKAAKRYARRKVRVLTKQVEEMKELNKKRAQAEHERMSKIISAQLESVLDQFKNGD